MHSFIYTSIMNVYTPAKSCLPVAYLNKHIFISFSIQLKFVKVLTTVAGESQRQLEEILRSSTVNWNTSNMLLVKHWLQYILIICHSTSWSSDGWSNYIMISPAIAVLLFDPPLDQFDDSEFVCSRLFQNKELGGCSLCRGCMAIVVSRAILLFMHVITWQ